MLKAKKVKISLVKENPSNPRIIKDEKFEKLVKSIKDFPEMLELRPIVVNKDYIALGGNQRLKACEAAGFTEVWILEAAHLSAEQQRQFIIKDNLGYGEWEWELLVKDFKIEELADWGLDNPGLQISPNNFGEDFKLSSGARQPFTQMTFTLASEQAEEIKAAIDALKTTKEFDVLETFNNENSNGNALYLLFKQWEEQKK